MNSLEVAQKARLGDKEVFGALVHYLECGDLHFGFAKVKCNRYSGIGQ